MCFSTLLNIYIYIWSRPASGNPPHNAIPPQPPQQPPPLGWPAIYHHPSRSHMLYLHAGLVPPLHYKTRYLHAVFTTAHTIYLQPILADKVPL